MKIFYIFCAFLFSTISVKCQVHVRGYYRSNGTYVAPHERTRPNSTIIDNYSYPGNLNPNKTSASDYKAIWHEEPEFYSASEGSKISPDGKENLYIKVGSARLRASPTTDGEIICTLSKRQRLFLIEDSGSSWKKVLYKYENQINLQSAKYVVGFISSNLLSRKYTENYIYYNGKSFKLPSFNEICDLNILEGSSDVTNYLMRKFENSKPIAMSGSSNDGNCLYTTNFNNPAIPVLLRNEPNVNAYSVYSCPKNSVVCVIDRNDPIFYRVKIDGQIGYVSKGFLIRQ